MFKRFKNWLIKKLGGYTREEYNRVMDKWENTLDDFDKMNKLNDKHLRIAESSIEYWCDKYIALEKTLRTVESYITIDSALGYTADNVIAESRQQTYYQLGKAVYPYAKHFITGDGVYLASVDVVDWEGRE